MNTKATTSDFIVVIPCYNDLTGLFKALSTVKYDRQFSILVIDDGSAEPIKREDITPVFPPSTTIELIRLSPNVGITKALNAGLNWILDPTKNVIDYKYVARLDCGDLCDENRFSKQVNFLEENNDIDLLGTWCVFENFETGDKFVYTTPTEDKEIRRAMYFRNIFIHPTVMWRTRILKKNNSYPEIFPHAEDYGLFYKWMDADIKTAVLPEELVTCRINTKGLSLTNRKGQLKSRLSVIRTFGKNRVLRALGVMKLWALMAIPYPLVFKMKKMLLGQSKN
ncbi:glycosyltransferase family 2 protein [Flavitalea sp.]|nr:glycosyltransferase [Flavitalea sp.]